MQRPTPGDDPDAWPTPTDLADSIDLRLLVAGRLTPTAIPIRRNRAELAAVLGHAPQPHADPRTNATRERNAA
jgi:hypothetical protein